MNKKHKRLFILAACLLLAAALLPASAFAVGKIEDVPASLTITYKDGDKAIAGAFFRLYKVADVDAYAEMTLTEDFKAYEGFVEGLDKLDDQTQESWLTMAASLKGYVLSDGLTPAASGYTDSEGKLVLSDLEVGLYLVVGSRVTLEDNYTYSAVPSLCFLPANDKELNAWDYDESIVPKFTKDYNPPEDDGDYVTRKVLKIWNDEAYKDYRPEEITVHLLKDGEICDTQKLNAENSWRYAWDNLDAKYEWDVIEDKVEGYAVTIGRTGITFTITNKYIEPINSGLPIIKHIAGATPKKAATFTFIFAAYDEDCPMPEGVDGDSMELSVVGAGTVEVGELTFTKAGTYRYTVVERNDSLKGYRYDDTIYTVTYEVTETDGDLSVERIITIGAPLPDEEPEEEPLEDLDGPGEDVEEPAEDPDGPGEDMEEPQDQEPEPETAEAVEFTNRYGKLPQTGVLWWPVPVLLLLGCAFLMLGLMLRRRNG